MIRRFIAELTFAALVVDLLSGCGQPRVSRPRVEGNSGDAAPETTKQTDPAVPRDVTFEDLHLDLPPDSIYESWMLPLRIETLIGKRIRLRGFICGAIFQLHNIHEFPLMREKECPYGPGGQAHHVAEVVLKPGATTDFTTDEICVEGDFSVKPYTGPNGKTWSLYRLEQATLCR